MKQRPLPLRARWMVGHLIIIVALVIMANLALWQLRRLHQSENRASSAKIAMNAPPIQLTPNNVHQYPYYQHVKVTGTWDAANTYLYRYPIYNGAEGYWVIEPVNVSDGSGRVFVNRGWISLAAGKAMIKPTDADGGSVQIDGLLRKAETEHRPVLDNGNDPAVPTQTAITQPWVQLVSPSSTGDPVPLDAPDLTTGSHFAYTVQWFSFCLIAILGWVSVIYRAMKEESELEAQNQQALVDNA